MYEIVIDRTKEPCSAKTLDKITSFADFTFKNDHTIDVRELTDAGAIFHLKENKIDKLWSSHISTSCLSTGVISEFDQSNAENVEPKFKKQKKEEQTKRLNEYNAEAEPNPKELSDNRCPQCNRVFLRRNHCRSIYCPKSKKCMETMKTKT